MTPERWRRVGELFAAALRVEPEGREAWLRGACGDDERALAEVARLLDQDARASRDRFLSAPGSTHPAHVPTGSWSSRVGRGRRPTLRVRSTDGPRVVSVAVDRGVGVGDGGEGGSGFSPRAAIVAGSRPYAASETESIVRARLRELPMIYILVLAMATFWRWVILGDDDRAIHYLDASVIAVLSGVIALLSGRLPVSLARLRALELGVIAMLAVRVVVAEYRIVLIFSMRGEPMMAQITVKNFVLVTFVLIVTYGLYVPKSWRRAALVVGPLAVLPFAILLVLYLLHPGPMSWLRQGLGEGHVPRVLLFTFDALLLGIIAAGSAFGARTISLLRRQVAEARRLGQYRLGERIGVGGMGEVYLAEHELLKRPCALKLIRPDGVADPRALARFEREVRLTATLSHPNTVEIYDYGRTEDGTYYYVMEYLRGLSLEGLVERHGPVPPARAVFLLRQVCRALGEAHASGLVHRDIKPSNIFASRRGGMDDVAKLFDFGLVLPAAGPGDPQMSGRGQVLGTPSFMSPEQATGDRELDGRSDIYSLGAVAYYLLTGRPPFQGDDGIGLLIAHARDPVEPPSRVFDGIPEDLERVVLRCLAKDPADRFPDSLALELALADCRCAEDWDLGRAARWWRDADRAPSTYGDAGDATPDRRPPSPTAGWAPLPTPFDG